MKGLLNKAFFNKNKASLSKEVLLASKSKRLLENLSLSKLLFQSSL